MTTIKKYKQLTYIACLVALAGTFSSCRKYLDIDLPKDQITVEKAFSTPANTLAAVNGLYTFALKSSNFLNYQGDELLGISADEFVFGSTQYDDFKNNTLAPENYDVWFTCILFYQVIYQANSVIDNLRGSSVSDSLKAIYIAESPVFR